MLAPLEWYDVLAIANERRANGEKIAIAHGFFDDLSVAEVRYLQHARRQADCLIVLVETFATRLTPRARAPQFRPDHRAQRVAALSACSLVCVPDQPLHQCCADLLPDVICPDSGVPRDMLEELQDLVRPYAGQVVRFPLTELL